MTAIAHQPHPVTRALAGARDQLHSVAEVPIWSMDPTETTATIHELNALAAQVAELQARVLHHADRIDLATNTGATSTANWYAHQTRTTRPAAHRAMRMAKGLEDHDLTRAALAEGRVHVEQAEAILRALADLPTGLDPDLVDQAERHLLELAEVHDAKALKVLGRRILEVIDPDAADAHEAALLEREERDAQAATRLVIWDDGHGKTHGRFTVDSSLTGAMLKKALTRSPPPSTRPPKDPSANAAPPPSGSATPSSNSSSATPPSASPKPAASTPPPWS